MVILLILFWYLWMETQFPSRGQPGDLRCWLFTAAYVLVGIVIIVIVVVIIVIVVAATLPFLWLVFDLAVGG